ncbi:hypothetical protein Tco_1196416 [Tanacetum coccineum]
MTTIKYFILPGASKRGPTMSIPHFQKGQANVMEIMSFFGNLVSSGRIPRSMYSCIGVIQVLSASSTIVFTFAISTDRSLSSSTNTPFVNPSHYTAASLLRASDFLFEGMNVFVDYLNAQGATASTISQDPISTHIDVTAARYKEAADTNNKYGSNGSYGTRVSGFIDASVCVVERKETK